MRNLRYCVTAVLFAKWTHAQSFNIYPDVSPDLLATAFNISSGCLTALNATVQCDQDLFTMAGNVDGYFWSDDNATALCTDTCQSSAASWFTSAGDACADDNLNAYGRIYPAYTVPGRFIDGVNIVCVTATTNLTQDVGVTGDLLTNSTSSFKRQSAESDYCLVQSYDWTGSDIIRPDCSDPANVNASQCIDPTDVPAENERIANLYPDDLLCSQCFLNLYYLRIASPYLPDLDYSDYLVDQWFDILDVCNSTASVPDLLVRVLPYYDQTLEAEIGPNNDVPGNGETTPLPLVSNSTYNATCQYRTITFADLPQEPDVPALSNTTDPCEVIPQVFNASTGDIWAMFGSNACLPDFNTTLVPSVCAPAACNVLPLAGNSTCDAFAATLDGNITTTQFLSWNPNLIGTCDNTTSQYVCGDAHGGTYISPPASNDTTGEQTQQRGGGNGGGTSTGSGGVGGSGRNATVVQAGGTVPSPVQSGIVPSCTSYAQVQSGDGCYSFSQDFGVAQQAFESWNPALGPNGQNCSTQLFLGYWYCVGVSGTPTTTYSSTPTVSPTPSPVQSGIDSQCNTYAEAVSGDTCSGFAAENNITPDQLYTWNPVLGSGGANCGTQFQANVYYCVGVPSSTGTTASPTATSTIAAAPSPTQSGIASDCDSYAEAVSGDSCYGFAQEHEITTTDLYTWNTVLGADGANCNTELFTGYYYCIGVAASSN